MSNLIFDDHLRRLRRDRAARLGPELFLLDRAFDDCLDRIGMVNRTFRSALLVGCPSPHWAARLRGVSETVELFDPGPVFAGAAGGQPSDEAALPIAPGTYDLCVAVGTLDTVNRLPDALLRLRLALRPDSLLLGAMAGGDTLPRLGSAMRAADDLTGVAAPHVHPRIEPSALAGLLASAGFRMPVVDVDRVQARYGSLRALVRDLRRMGATNSLVQRPRQPLSRRQLEAAERAFLGDGPDGRATETFEILHFAGWTPEGSA